MRSPRVLLASFVVASLLVPAGTAAGATHIAQELDLSPSYHFYIQLHASNATNGSDIDLDWDAQAPIDVFVLSSANFEAYKNGRTFAAEVNQSGLAGTVLFNISASRQAEEPFYIVFDNSFQGGSPGSAGAVHVSLDGDTRMSGWQGGSSPVTKPGASPVLLSFAVIVALVAVGVLVFARARKKKTHRLGEARRKLYEGAPAAAPAAPAAEGPRGLPTAAQIRGKVCKSCGSAAPAANTFCNHCGSPL